MIEPISSAFFHANSSPKNIKKQRDDFLAYASLDSDTNSDILHEENSGLININEEFERSLSSAAGIKSALFTEPSYSVSGSQAEYFSQKYDLENMPQGSVQERDFLNELVSMNIISEKDAKLFNFNCGGSVESVSSCVSVVPFDGNSSEWSLPMWEDRYSDTDNIIDRLWSVIDTQKNINAYYSDKCSGENAEKCDFDGLKASREFFSSKQRIMSVLQSIAQNK